MDCRRYARELDRVRYATARDHAAFHKAMAKAPRDGTTALVYADVLEEEGKPTHAEMIRRHFDPDVAQIQHVYKRHFPHNGVVTAEPYQHHDGRRSVTLTIPSAAHPKVDLNFRAVVDEAERDRLIDGLRGEGARVLDPDRYAPGPLSETATTTVRRAADTE